MSTPYASRNHSTCKPGNPLEPADDVRIRQRHTSCTAWLYFHFEYSPGRGYTCRNTLDVAFDFALAAHGEV